MPRIGIAMFICAAALVGRGLEQTVSGETKAALADEWADATAKDHCLKALELYSSDSRSAEALAELAGGTSDSRVKDLHAIAQELGALPELLATAAKRSIDKNDPKAVAAVFLEADNAITAAYEKDPRSLMDGVSKVSASNRLKALYNLLNTSKDAAAMETFRTCYALDRDRLFRLVSDHFR